MAKSKTKPRRSGKNYAQRLRERREAEDRVITMWATQLTLDVMAALLNDKYGFGSKRLTDLSAEFNERWPEYMRAITKDPESDYIRDKIDRQQEQIFGEDYLHWEDRYYGWE